MSVISVKESWRELSTTVEYEHGTAVRKFTVIVDDANSAQGIFTARDADGIPYVDDVHPYDPQLYVVRKTARPFNGSKSFLVTVNYESDIIDPIDQDPVESWSFASTSKKIDTDVDGLSIVNSSGEGYDPPIMAEVHDLVYRMERNEASYNSVFAAEYMGAVNSDYWYGFEPGTCKITIFDATSAKAGVFEYYKVVYEIRIRWAGWGLKLIDEGFREYLGADSEGKPEYEEIKDKDGNPISSPHKLNGNGRKLDDGAAIALREYDIYFWKPFAFLGV